jgi:anti-anti-sigma regulatory factor
MTATMLDSGLVTSTRLADGLLVQLAGDLGSQHVDELRRTLLAPLPAGCRDVVIDAGEVNGLDFDALAVVFAAWAWAEEHGARFLLSRTSAAFEEALELNGVIDDLPRLSELATAPIAPVVPLQRVGAV